MDASKFPERSTQQPEYLENVKDAEEWVEVALALPSLWRGDEAGWGGAPEFTKVFVIF